MSRPAIAAAVIALSLAACGGGAAPPPVVKRETPGDHIRRIGQVWEERTAADGFLTPPSDVDRFRIEGRMEITIEDPNAPTAKELVERTETFTMRDGRTFRCGASTTARASVAYEWRGAEPAVKLGSPPMVLTRRCDPAGYPHPEKRLDAATLTLVLRDDRLVAIDPPLAKDVLVPTR